MLKFKINGYVLRTFTDTKFRVEWDSPVFSDNLIPGPIVYTFEVPTMENIEIFGYAYERNEINLPARYAAEVLWLDGSWMRGFLVLQRIAKYKYSVGFYFSNFPEGFGDQYVASALPTVDFYGKLAEVLYVFAGETQGESVDYSIEGTVRTFTVDVQAPLMVTDDSEYFKLRNTKNPFGTLMGENYYTDPPGTFNKKLISASMYLKSALAYVLADYSISGAWWDDAFISEFLILNGKFNSFTENQKKVRVKAHWVLESAFEYGHIIFNLVADEIEGDSTLYTIGTSGEFVYTPGAQGFFVVEYQWPNIPNTYVYLFTEEGGSWDEEKYLANSFIGKKDLGSHVPAYTIRIKFVSFFTNLKPLPTSFYVNFYEEGTFLQKSKSVIDYGTLLPDGYTKGDLLRNVLPTFGGLMFLDAQRKNIEIATINQISTAAVIDLTAHMVDWYTEPVTPKQRTYSYDQPSDYQNTSVSGLLSALPEPQASEILALEGATHAIYKSDVVGGRIAWVRLQSERDVVRVGMEVEKNETTFSLSAAENSYLYDHFELWEADVEYELAETVIYNGALWGSNVATNTSEPGTNTDWEFITAEAILPIVPSASGIVLAHFKGIEGNERVCATATKFDKTGAGLAGTDMQLTGEEGIFEKYLRKIDALKNKNITIFQLDGKIDIDRIRELFMPSTEAQPKPRRFRVGDVVYVPSQFSVVLTNFGIEEAQIKGVPA